MLFFVVCIRLVVFVFHFGHLFSSALWHKHSLYRLFGACIGAQMYVTTALKRMVSYNTHWNGRRKKAPNAEIIYQFLELYELLCDYKTVYWRRFECSKMRLVFITGPFIITIIQSCVSFTTHDALFYVNICFCHVHVLLIVCPVNCTEKKFFFFSQKPIKSSNTCNKIVTAMKSGSEY